MFEIRTDVRSFFALGEASQAAWIYLLQRAELITTYKLKRPLVTDVEAQPVLKCSLRDSTQGTKSPDKPAQTKTRLEKVWS